MSLSGKYICRKLKAKHTELSAAAMCVFVYIRHICIITYFCSLITIHDFLLQILNFIFFILQYIILSGKFRFFLHFPHDKYFLFYTTIKGFLPYEITTNLFFSFQVTFFLYYYLWLLNYDKVLSLFLSLSLLQQDDLCSSQYSDFLF